MTLGKRFPTMAVGKAAAKKASKDGSYVTLFGCFGLYMDKAKRLSVHAPTDSCYPAYWHNGKEYPFTQAQKILDQNTGNIADS